MNFLFWLCWVINVLIVLLAFIGKGFRDSFGANAVLNIFIMVCMLAILAGSLVVRFGVKQKSVSLVMVMLPLLAMLIWYVIDQRKS